MHFLSLLLPLLTFFMPGTKKADLAKYRSYPHVLTVAQYFDDHVRINKYQGSQINLAKKPLGWYVIRTNYNSQFISEFMIWSYAKKEFIAEEEIHPELPNESDMISESEHFNTFHVQGQYNFERCIYSGYPRWQNDVINELEGASNLNDSLLESLARAYEEASTQIVRPAMENYNSPQRTLSDADVQLFCTTGDKIIATYLQLQTVNRNYECLVGRVHTKLSNEYMFMWSELMEKGRNKEAQKYLVDDLYDPLLLNFANNFLIGLDKNAILFTNGDNDTYPLWYVQQKRAFRPDVAVINLSLINIPDWLFFAKEQHPFYLTIPENIYRDTMSDFLLVTKSYDHAISFNDFVSAMLKKDNAVVEESSGVYRLPCNSLTLSTGVADKTPLAKIDHSYFLKSDLFVYDMIASSHNEYSIYFTTTIGMYPPVDGLQNFIEQQGLVCKISNKELEHSPGEFYADRKTLENNMLRQYRYGMQDGKQAESDAIISNYVTLYLKLFQLEFDGADKEAALNTLTSLTLNINQGSIRSATSLYLIAEAYHKIGRNKQADIFAGSAIDRVKYDKDPNDADDNRSILEYIIQDGNGYSVENKADAQALLLYKLNDH